MVNAAAECGRRIGNVRPLHVPRARSPQRGALASDDTHVSRFASHAADGAVAGTVEKRTRIVRLLSTRGASRKRGGAVARLLAVVIDDNRASSDGFRARQPGLCVAALPRLSADSDMNGGLLALCVLEWKRFGGGR